MTQISSIPQLPDFPTIRERRAFIDLIQDAMLTQEQIEVPCEHVFSEGLYARHMLMKAGTIAVGKIHKTENYFLLATGRVSIMTVEGVVHLTAPTAMVTPPGVKRIAYAHEDSLLITVHPNPTNEKDLDKLELAYIAPTYADLDVDAYLQEIGRLQ